MVQQRMRRTLGWLVGLSLVVGPGASLTPPAAADGDPTTVAQEKDRSDVSDVGDLVDLMAGPAPEPAVLEGGDLVAEPTSSLTVELPADPDGGLAMDIDGAEVVLGLPGDAHEHGEATGGSMVFGDVADSASLVARPTSDGVQALVVITGADAPVRYRFPVTVEGEGASLLLRPDGWVEVRRVGDPVPVATVMPAWARDAAGRSVGTHFEIDGSGLVQVVDHVGAAYPVIADPNTCGWTTCTYYFGKRATRDISAAKNAAAGCGFLYPVPAAAAGCAVAWAAVSIQADRAHARGMCLKIKYTKSWPVLWWPDIYRGGYCR